MNQQQRTYMCDHISSLKSEKNLELCEQKHAFRETLIATMKKEMLKTEFKICTFEVEGLNCCNLNTHRGANVHVTYAINIDKEKKALAKHTEYMDKKYDAVNKLIRLTTEAVMLGDNDAAIREAFEDYKRKLKEI